MRHLERSGGIPCISGAAWLASHELVVLKFVSLIFFKWRHLADRSCISVAPLWTIHEPILSKFVCRIFSWSGAERWNSTGGLPPVKWRPLMDRSCISVALLRTIQELILSKFVCRIFFNDVKMALGVM